MRRLLPLGALFLAYLATARFGLSLASLHPSVTPVWAPTGLAIAAVLILGRRAWAPVFLAAFAVNLSVSGALGTSLGIAVGNTLEAIVGAYLTTRWAGGVHALDRPASIFRFALLMPPAAAVSATVGVTSLALGNAMSWSSAGSLWLTWWLGDVSGAIIVTPLVLAWREPERWSLARGQLVEKLLLLCALFVLAALTFGGQGPWPPRAPLAFLTIPPIVWAAFRFGQRETTTAVALLSMAATWSTLRGIGPFVMESPNTSLMIAEAFIGMLMATMLPMAAVVVQWRRAEAERTGMLAQEQAARRSAEATSSAKDEFLAMLGHELRNPLSAISSAAHVLNVAEPTTDAARRAREVLDRQIRHLASLVDDLLDGTRIRTGKIMLHRTLVDFAALVRTCADGRRPMRIDVPPGSLWVEGDATRLEQIVSNLLINAVKYTPAGRDIRVSVSAGDGRVVLRVEDEGIGIPADLLPRIFDQFVQAETDPARTHGGLGLGLTLVRHLVELHGGTVTAASDGPDRGSVFVVSLPASAAPEPALADDVAPTVPATRRRVLLIEDQADVRGMLRMALELAGHEVLEAENGPAGVEASLRLSPDVVFVDLGLPGFDGCEVARRLRAQRGDAVYLIAVTGYGQPADRERTAAAGFDLHLVKPVDPLRLADLVGAARGEVNSAARTEN